MDARVALELTELENRVTSRGITPEQMQDVQAGLRAEVEALSGRLSTEMQALWPSSSRARPRRCSRRCSNSKPS